MDIKSVAEGLHPLERKILPFLKSTSDVEVLAKDAGMQEVEARRALQWLEAKELVTTTKQVRSLIILDENGKKYKEKGLPEVIFLNELLKGPLTLNDLTEKGVLEKEEVMVSLGILKSKSAIAFVAGNLSITEQGKLLIQTESSEHNFLIENFPLALESLNPSQKIVFDSLMKRKKIISIDKISDLFFKLTSFGNELVSFCESSDVVENIESLTPEMIQRGDWKEKKFRTYNINASTPKITGGRRHPLDLIIDKMKQIWLEMGFKEMEGPWVESAFWCMDSMWIPQDHPAREMQDTFYLPYQGKLPKNIAKKVAKAHETGGKSGSKGYGYKWDPEVAKKLVLRTHTTSTTFRKFAEGVDAPEKYFCIGRIFRNETVDATHLPEFHQIEGFIMGKGLTLRDLMGYIQEFYKRMGITKIKFRPTYNPYTEPSMEALGYNEQLGKWIELINSGMFRPEALDPYGIKVPVIAWGLGVERLAMMVYGRSNIREIFGSNSDIDWLRNYQLPKDVKENNSEKNYQEDKHKKENKINEDFEDKEVEKE
ncbi:MAG: phenylalanine--tRNA ligase subunit alpha [Candidatus Woesearchaeota archaeon]|jgi:phenylalanyl-tRNA synthetase alpha chain